MATFGGECNTNFQILSEDLSGECQEHQHLKRNNSAELRSIEEIPHPYQEIFADYANFNVIQSRVIDDVLYADDSLVVSAPTGSGKTVIFELAIVRLLISLEHSQNSIPFKIVYICPMKALCEERVVDWHRKFSNFGINSIAVTGDSERIEFQDLLNHNLIITTPEKWDCLTRKWRENIKLVRIVRLFMIDEIHLLNEEARGSTLEAIVCRMKTIEKAINTEEDDKVNRIRFLAVSATVPNLEDVAEWLGESSKCHKFSDEYRPVKLNKIVLGYNQAQKVTPFKFDLSLNYKLHTLIMQYSHGKPTLIFCGTRKIVEMTARHVLQHLTINLKPEQKQCLLEASSFVTDVKIRETLVHGIGYHHAGMLPQTRRVIEDLFRNGDLPILVTTSTLAVGVNLPAHLVIVKSTKCYANGGFRDYTETAILQMIGRAGRPQFDTEATALILTSARDKVKFEKMIGGLQPVESNLHRNLIEHLNAEVVLQTITDLEVAMRWLSSTFLYIRARKNPRYYGLTSSDPSSIDRTLLEMCQIELNKLIKAGMLTIDQDALLAASPVGAAMAKYYLFFETMKLFTQITGNEILQQILSLISKCHEFSEMYLRVNDKKCLNLLNKCRDRQTIRFPLNGKIKTLDMKINCIIQAVLGCLDISEHSLLTETLKVMRNGERIVRCLTEYLEFKDNCFQALLNTIILAKCFHVQLWENSHHVSKQLPGIGNVTSSQLVNAGKTTFQAILETDPRELELIMNKKAPAGSKMHEQIHHLPRYNLRLEPYGKNKVKLSISLENSMDLERSCTVNRNSLMYLVVGDSCNNVLLYEKYSHCFLIESPDVVRFIDFQENCVEDLEAYFVSEDWVGIDCATKLEIAPKPKGKTPKIVKKNQNDLTYMQKFLKMYNMKCKKTEDDQATDDKNEERSPKENDQNKSVFSENTNRQIIIHGNMTVVGKDEKFCQKGDAEDRSTLKSIENLAGVLSQDSSGFKADVSSSCSKTSQNLEYASSGTSLDKGDIKEKFAFNSKKFTHKRSMEEEPVAMGDAVLVEPPNKRRDFDSKPKITWRSPLTYSPPVKFSPKIVSCDQNSVSTSRASSSNSVIAATQEASNTKIKSSNSFQRTPLKLNSSQKITFPLTDKECADSSLASLESVDKRDEALEKVADIADMENLGLIHRPSKNKVQSHVRTPNEYYRHLLSQTQTQERNIKNDNEEKFPVAETDTVQKRIPSAIGKSQDVGKTRLPEGSRKTGHDEMRRSSEKPIFSRSRSSERRQLEAGDHHGDQKKMERSSFRNDPLYVYERAKKLFLPKSESTDRREFEVGHQRRMESGSFHDDSLHLHQSGERRNFPSPERRNFEVGNLSRSRSSERRNLEVGDRRGDQKRMESNDPFYAYESDGKPSFFKSDRGTFDVGDQRRVESGSFPDDSFQRTKRGSFSRSESPERIFKVGDDQRPPGRAGFRDEPIFSRSERRNRPDRPVCDPYPPMPSPSLYKRPNLQNLNCTPQVQGPVRSQIPISIQSLNRLVADYPSFADQRGDFPDPFLPESHMKNSSTDSDLLFDDSLDEALMECSIPSPDEQNCTVARAESRSSVYFEDQNRSRSRCKTPAQREYPDRSLSRCRTPGRHREDDSDHQNFVSYTNDAFADDGMSWQISDCDPLELQTRENLRREPLDYHPSWNQNAYVQQQDVYDHQNVYQNYDFDQDGRLQTHDLNYRPVYPEIARRAIVEHSYAMHPRFRGSAQIERSFPPRDRGYSNFAFKDRDYSHDGYSYLRRIMERDDELLTARGPATDPRTRGVEAPRAYPEAIPMQDPRNFQHPTDYADVPPNYNFENPTYGNNNNNNNDPLPPPGRRASARPPIEDHPERSYFDGRSHPEAPREDARGSDKLYLMRKFFKGMGKR